MSIIDKAKEAGNLIKDKSFEMVNDDKFADLVIMAASKQESVNKILKARGANFRISDIDIGMGIPPHVSFGIRPNIRRRKK